MILSWVESILYEFYVEFLYQKRSFSVFGHKVLTFTPRFLIRSGDRKITIFDARFRRVF